MNQPDAITEITKANFKRKCAAPRKRLDLCRSRYHSQAAAYGVTTIGELAALDPAFLKDVGREWSSFVDIRQRR